MENEQLAIFQEIWLAVEHGLPISKELEEQALSHGLRVEAVKEAALASVDIEDDFE